MKKIIFTILILFTGISTAHASYNVDFEGTGETNGAYASATVGLGESFFYPLNWNVGPEALIGTTASDIKNGSRAARIRLNAGIFGSLTMTQDKTTGIGTVSFQYARSNFSGDRTGVSPVFVVEYSRNSGASWLPVGSSINTAGVDSLTTFSQVVNKAGNNIRLRIRQTAGDEGKRFNIDDIFIGNYVDTKKPDIYITAPTKTSVSAITNVSIQATDDEILASNVTISSTNTTGSFSISNISCIQTNSGQVDCTLQIDGNIGTGDITVSAIDISGNTQSLSELGFTIVPIQTSTPATPTLQSASDTGVSNTDKIISTTTPSFDITCLANSEVILYSNGSDTGDNGTGTCLPGGTLTLTPTLFVGTQDITITQLSNLLGSTESLPSIALNITIDTTPITPTINKKSGQQDPTPLKSSVFTITSSEDIDTTDIDINTFSVASSTAPGTLITSITFPTTKTIEVTTTSTGDGDITLTLATPSDIKDIAGNLTTLATIIDATVAISAATDSDGDGNPDLLEDAGPNSGDANGDGFLDSTQQNVSSITNHVTGTYTALEASGTCTFITENTILSESSLTVQDPNADYPVGLVDFQVECTNPGESTNVTIYYTQVYDTSKWKYRKYDGTGNEYADISDKITFATANVGGTPVTIVSFTLTDGDPETDEDGIADRFINDPSGPAILTPKKSSASRRLIPQQLVTTLSPTETTTALGGETLCPSTQLLTQNMKAGDRNNTYSSWQKGTITEVKLLQTHMNRLGFNSGVVDGILGPITDGAIKRMQTSLGTTADGYVGPLTRALINMSCSEETV